MTRRNTVVRDHSRKVIAQTKPPCALCGTPIDYNLKYPHPGSFVVDHIVPLAQGGPDNLQNMQAAHNTCNRDKHANYHGQTLKRSTTLARPQGGTPSLDR